MRVSCDSPGSGYDPDLRQQQRDGGKVAFDKGLVRSWRMDVEDVTEGEIKDDSLMFQL